MHLGNIHHCIKFKAHGQEFTASIYLEHRATYARMKRYLLQCLIDEGVKPRDVYDVKFFFDGKELKPSDGGRVQPLLS